MVATRSDGLRQGEKSAKVAPESRASSHVVRVMGGITVVARIVSEDRCDLAKLLGEIDRETRSRLPRLQVVMPFDRIETLHFARLVLLDVELVIVTSFDGSKDRHYKDLAELLSTAGAGDKRTGFDSVLRYCEGYWNYTGPVAKRIASFLKDHDVGTQTHFVGAVGLTVQQILEDERLRAKASEELRKVPDGTRAAGASKVYATVRAAIAGGLPKEALSPPPNPTGLKKALASVAYYGGALAKLGAAAAVLPGIAALYPVLWQEEWLDAKALERERQALRLRDRAAQRREDDETIADMDKLDQRFVPMGVQKPLTHVALLKAGLTRSIALRVALSYVAFRAEYWDDEGSLAGISSIHFARWISLPGRRVLFCSDYDGSWESYIGDFVDEGASGLSAIWSNTRDFPRTKGLITQGARDERGFKLWVRKHQIATQVWYSAYPKLSMQRILKNKALRLGLANEELEPDQASAWLALV